jgi:20S proteasome alpha/beta subunit
VEEGLKLCVKALVKVLDKNFSVDRIDAACIMTKERMFTKVKRDKIDKIFREMRKK